MFALRYASKLEKLLYFSHSCYQVNVSTFSKYVYIATRIQMISVNFAFAFLHRLLSHQEGGVAHKLVISPCSSCIIG